MTKAELLAAIADAPDDAVVYIDDGSNLLRSEIAADVVTVENYLDIVISYSPREEGRSFDEPEDDAP